MAALESLALDICAQVCQINSLLDSAATARPSFAESSHNDFNDDSTNGELRDARNKLINSAQDIVRLTSGPTDQVLGIAFAASDSANLGIIVRFDIAQAVPIGSTIRASELAKAVGLDEDILVRIVRYGIRNGIFVEPKQNHFAHSAVSALLAHSEHARNVAMFSTHELASALIKLPDALMARKNLKDQAPLAAFNVAYPDYEDAFEYFQKNAEANGRYHAYLNGRVNTSRWAVHHFLASWEWASVGSGTIIDCGGSIGHTCLALSSICPEASFIVQDMSVEAMDSGKKNLASQHPNVASRISFVEHDFFTPQTVSADIYIFRHILHDWSDADCLRILHSLVPALKHGAKVLISEGVVPESTAQRTSILDEKQIWIEDALMLSMHYAQERSVSGFAKLFKDASPHFRLNGVYGGTNGAFQSLLEFEYYDPKDT